MNVGRGGALTALVLLVAIGCGGSDAAPPNQGGGGTVVVDLPDGGKIEVPPAPAPPDPGGSPTTGVYVSASKGIEGADGAPSRPLKTLAAGMQLAAQKRLPVFACAEVYKEQVTLVDGVTVFGYFDCSAPEWVRTAAHAKIESPATPGVLAENLTIPARFEGFDVTVPDLAGVASPGAAAASSIGMIIRSTKNLAIAEMIIRAGKGQDGADGIDPPENNVEMNPNPTGRDAKRQRVCLADNQVEFCNLNFVSGAPGGTSQCKVGQNGHPGGAGGDAPVSRNGTYQAAVHAYLAVGRPGTATATQAAGGVANNVGYNPGSNGRSGDAGSNGNHGAWAFAGDNFVPGDGTEGSIGGPGQGGGGGAGSSFLWANSTTKYDPLPATETHYGPGGAGGGAGGCGGLPGTAGKGGGASIGLLVLGSEKIKIESARIEGKKGGRAGKGALGHLGTPGNFGGAGRHLGQVDTRPPGLYGAAGGKGGDGGPAGLGGHGAPGPSIALVFRGVRPESVNVELIPGQPGDGHAQTTRGTQTLPPVTGDAKFEHQFQ